MTATHELFKPEDFTPEDFGVDEVSCRSELAILVVEQGLSICKMCGVAESQLEAPCLTEDQAGTLGRAAKGLPYAGVTLPDMGILAQLGLFYPHKPISEPGGAQAPRGITPEGRRIAGVLDL